MFFERPGGGERAILVHLDGQDPAAREDPQEFQELARSAGAETVGFVNVSRHQPSAKFLIGSGKVEELHELVKEGEAELVIFNHTLTPSQERNLERALECRVLDRTGLILDIFAQRARTHEGKLQVELAQLEHMSTRLVRGWTHLERQKGGIGLRGPGETQLETDRRLLRVRIRQIKQRLEKVRGQREQARADQTRGVEDRRVRHGRHDPRHVGRVRGHGDEAHGVEDPRDRGQHQRQVGVAAHGALGGAQVEHPATLRPDAAVGADAGGAVVDASLTVPGLSSWSSRPR